MTDNVPVWLFSFVDLAFLLIIAMTQIGVDSNGISLELGEILIPRIESDATQNLPGGSAERWQLRVHPMDETRQQPFELTRPGAENSAPEALGDADELRRRLTNLHAEGTAKTHQAPHEDSRSQDMLDAVGMLEQLWPSGRRATVARLLANR
ncbi:MAG: hypothetical protein VX574_01680 [Myxococcota bacterium]|nr:hypothetical protein [Myxococcota bacterium]